MSRLGFVFGTLCVCGLMSTAPRADTEPTLLIPPNLVFESRLQDIAAHMLQRSPTFRDQCAYLGRVALLHVRFLVQVVPVPPGQSPCRAEARMRRFEYGRIEAIVRLPSRRDVVELISHELEHVREYVEGANYQFLAARTGTGVWMGANGHFETARAVAMGRRVAGEVESKIAPD